MNTILATDIKPLLSNKYEWRISTPDEMHVTDGYTVYVISDEVLRAYHEDFPVQLRRAFAFYKDAFDEEDIHGFIVSLTLKYLQYGPIKLTVEGTSVLLGAVSKLEKIASKPDMLHIEGTKVRLVDVEYQGELVEAIVCGHTVKDTVPQRALDEAFPDWDKRLEIAGAMGLEGEDTFNYVFHSTHPKSRPSKVELSEIKFDL